MHSRPSLTQRLQARTPAMKPTQLTLLLLQPTQTRASGGMVGTPSDLRGFSFGGHGLPPCGWPSVFAHELRLEYSGVGLGKFHCGEMWESLSTLEQSRRLVLHAPCLYLYLYLYLYLESQCPNTEKSGRLKLHVMSNFG